MHRIIRHILNRGSSSEQQSQGDPPPVPIPSLAKMSTNLARKSLAANTNSSDAPKVRIGICAMDKKARSKPMKEIVSRLLAYGEFEMVYFGDELILEHPPEEWPEVDCLLSWYSDGFPLAKAQAYADLRRPFLVNDLAMQDVLMDRRAVYQVLRDNNIPTPTHIVVNRDNLPPGADPPGFIEEEDYVELDGVRIAKPFVEKPVSGEDHNIWIFYPSSMGGGVKRLFRKVNDKSSTYDPNHAGNVRRAGSYIYEEFLATGGTDVKVYTVGPRYAHAEARKSPVVDGKVLRAADGKEMRFPVLLTPQEKEIARMVTLAFAQKVCGFDLLRSEKGKSYVCDVNGWSFVKSSKKYYDDASGILRSIILSALAPHRLATAPPAPGGGRSSIEGGGVLGATAEGEEGPLGSLTKNSSLQELTGLAEVSGAELASLATLSGWDLEELRRTEELAAHEELRCLAAVVRHGDRTPKQKMKVRITHPRLLALFNKYKDSKGKQAKLKSPHQLQELLDITRQLLAELEQEPPSPQQASQQPQSQSQQQAAAGKGSSQQQQQQQQQQEPKASPGVTWELPAGWPASEEEREELREKFRIVRTVLEQGGQFSGINRKVQFKPLVWGPPASPSVTSGGAPARTSSAGGATNDPQQQPALFSVPSLAIPATASSGSTGGQEPKGSGGSGTGGTKAPQPELKEALMILKWGGVLTHAGRQQAEDLGRIFRLIMYPRYGAAGGGLLRLHSTYRHDLKIYSSDEGRVQSSAAAFTKGLLDLEGESLTPILVSLVQKDASMLDAFGKGASEDIKNAKQVLYTTMTWDHSAGGPAAAAPSAPITPTAANSPSATPGRLSPSPSAAAPQGEQQQALGVQQQQQAGGAGGKGGVQGVNGSVYGAASSSSSTTDMSVLTTMTDQQQEGPSTGPSQQQQQQPPSAAAAAGGGGPSGVPQQATNPLAAAQQVLQQQQQQGPGGGPPLSSFPSLEQPGGGGVRGDIPHMPVDPLQHLRSLHGLMKLLVDQLRDMCVAERPDPAGDALARYSSLSQDPREWACVPGHPCSGEKLLLMFDRWQKLTKSFFKKGRFDISKVPDIYDSAKHDVLHNSHLQLAVLDDLYYEAKVLADAVIPNEYGLDPPGKLTIGSKICSELLGKLLSDLESMRQESLATMAEDEGSGLGLMGGEAGPLDDDDIGRVSLQDEAMLLRQVGTPAPGTPPGASPAPAGSAGGASVPGGEEVEGEEFREEPETIHRLCPMYASDINSPLRHVRTRIYFTSESHMHSLLNVLRYCHLDVSVSRPAHSTPSSAPLSTMGSVDPAAGAAFAAAAGGSSGASGGAGAGAGPSSHRGAAGAAAAAASSPAAAADGLVGDSRGASPRVTSGSVPYYFNSSVPPSAALSHSSSTNSRAGDAATADLAAAAAAAVGSSAGGAGGGRGGGEAGGSGGGGSGSSSGSRVREPLLSDEAAQMLDATSELDYLTQVVFRMYENKAVPADHPNRFRVEVLFSSGASYNPVTTVPPLHNHTLPAKPRMSLHRGTGVSLAAFKAALGPRASTKRQPQPQAYALTVGLKAPSPHVAKAAAGALSDRA